jgi:tRNA-dihydrouridine synthase C
MRLGISDTLLAVECAQALEAGGIDALIVHGRTKEDGYRPPARWAEIARVAAAVKVPVIANGEIWTVDDWRRIREESGCRDVMLGRGALADPFLPRRIRGEEIPAAAAWVALQPWLARYWHGVRQRVVPAHAGGRLKQWLMLLRRHAPQAETLYQQLRPIKAAEDIDAHLIASGVLPPNFIAEVLDAG